MEVIHFKQTDEDLTWPRNLVRPKVARMKTFLGFNMVNFKRLINDSMDDDSVHGLSPFVPPEHLSPVFVVPPVPLIPLPEGLPKRHHLHSSRPKSTEKPPNPEKTSKKSKSSHRKTTGDHSQPTIPQTPSTSRSVVHFNMDNSVERMDIMQRILRQMTNAELKDLFHQTKEILTERGVITFDCNRTHEESVNDELGRLITVMSGQLKIEYIYNPDFPNTYGIPTKAAPYDSLSHLLDPAIVYEALGRLPTVVLDEYIQILISGNMNSALKWVEDHVSIIMIEKRLGMAKAETLDYYTLDFFKRVSKIVENKFEVWSIGKPGQDAMTELRKDVTTLLDEIKRIRMFDLIPHRDQDDNIYGKLPSDNNIVPKGPLDPQPANREPAINPIYSAVPSTSFNPRPSDNVSNEPAAKKRKFGGGAFSLFG